MKLTALLHQAMWPLCTVQIVCRKPECVRGARRCAPMWVDVLLLAQ